MSYVRWFFSVLFGFLNILKKRRAQKAEAERQRLEEEQRRLRDLEDDIEQEVSSIPKPDLDPSEDSEDPGGFGGWNRGN